MPLSPEKVLNRINMNYIKETMESIDFRLLKPFQIDTTTSNILLTVSDLGLSLKEREYIHQEYEKVGWKKVYSVTTGETGQKPGLIYFYLRY